MDWSDQTRLLLMLACLPVILLVDPIGRTVMLDRARGAWLVVKHILVYTLILAAYFVALFYVLSEGQPIIFFLNTATLCAVVLIASQVIARILELFVRHHPSPLSPQKPNSSVSIPV